MSRASQPERQLGDRLLRKELVDGEPDRLAPEARQLGEQRRRIDFEHEPAGAEAGDLAVRSQGWTQDLVERLVVALATLAAPSLLQDVAQEVADWLWFGHGNRSYAQTAFRSH